MSTLSEIEEAAGRLSAEEQKELLRFLLRVIPAEEGTLPKPRIFTDEEIQGWLADDAEGMREFREGA